LTTFDQPALANAMAIQSDPLGFFMGLATRSGNFVRYQLPVDEAYFINDPLLIREVFIKEDARFARWSFYPNWAKVLGQDGIFNTDGKLHQRMRQLARPAFQPNRISNYAAQMVDSAQQRMSSWQDGEIIDLQHEMSLLTIDIASQTLFGVKLEERVEGLYTAVHTTLDHKALILGQQHERLERLSIANRLGQRANDRLSRTPAAARIVAESIGEMVEIGRFILDERRRTGQADDDLLSILLLGQKEIPEAFSDEQIHFEIRNYLLAAHVTTGNVLAAAWWHLAHDPELSAALHKTLDASLGGRPPTLVDVPALKICEHILLEGLRLYPPIWFLAREALEEVSIGGHTLPAKAKLGVVPWVLHRDPEHFPEPDRFLPSRWENDARARLPRGAFLPFSAGSRSCLGEHFAILESVLALACVASQWEFQAVPGQPEPGWTPQTILWPRQGVHLRAVRRSA
jgi:cytochrome P450